MVRNTLFGTKALHLQTSHKSLPYVAHKVTTSIRVSGIRSRVCCDLIWQIWFSLQICLGQHFKKKPKKLRLEKKQQIFRKEEKSIVWRKMQFLHQESFSSSCHQVQCLTHHMVGPFHLSVMCGQVGDNQHKILACFCATTAGLVVWACCVRIKRGHSLDHSSDWMGSGQVQLCFFLHGKEDNRRNNWTPSQPKKNHLYIGRLCPKHDTLFASPFPVSEGKTPEASRHGLVHCWDGPTFTPAILSA